MNREFERIGKEEVLPQIKIVSQYMSEGNAWNYERFQSEYEGSEPRCEPMTYGVRSMSITDLVEMFSG